MIYNRRRYPAFWRPHLNYDWSITKGDGGDPPSTVLHTGFNLLRSAPPSLKDRYIYTVLADLLVLPLPPRGPSTYISLSFSDVGKYANEQIKRTRSEDLYIYHEMGHMCCSRKLVQREKIGSKKPVLKSLALKIQIFENRTNQGLLHDDDRVG